MIFLHISNRSEVRLMSILKLFVNTNVSFLKRNEIIISLYLEYSGFRFMNGNSKKEKVKKKKKIIIKNKINK